MIEVCPLGSHVDGIRGTLNAYSLRFPTEGLLLSNTPELCPVGPPPPPSTPPPTPPHLHIVSMLGRRGWAGVALGPLFTPDCLLQADVMTESVLGPGCPEGEACSLGTEKFNMAEEPVWPTSLRLWMGWKWKGGATS